MTDSLAGRVCLVTGASRGIGAATAQNLARQEAHVVGTYRSRTGEARAIEAKAATDGLSLRMEPCDVTSTDDVARLVESVLTSHGRIDGLVNNAGTWRGGRLATLRESDWRAVLETDLASVFSVTQSVLPSMLAAESGRIVNVTSVIGTVGYPGDSAYSAAKAGVNLLTKSLAKEVAGSGLAVNAVAPGPVETEMTSDLGNHALSRLLERVPLGRQGRADEVAEVIAFLLQAPCLLNGAIIALDGAMS